MILFSWLAVAYIIGKHKERTRRLESTPMANLKPHISDKYAEVRKIRFQALNTQKMRKIRKMCGKYAKNAENTHVDFGSVSC